MLALIHLNGDVCLLLNDDILFVQGIHARRRICISTLRIQLWNLGCFKHANCSHINSNKLLMPSLCLYVDHLIIQVKYC